MVSELTRNANISSGCFIQNYQLFMKGSTKQESQYHPIQSSKQHEKALDYFLPQINEKIGKEYKFFDINHVFGQYVHTRWYMYHLTSNNGDKLTVCMQIYSFEPDSYHGFVDFVYTGHMKPITAQKKLIQMDCWPSCGAFYRASECETSQAQNCIYNHIEQINGKLEMNENSYTIVKCWAQCVQGTNYFMHLVSNTGKKVSVGMYVPFDYDEEDRQFEREEKREVKKEEEVRPVKKMDEEDDQQYDLKFEISFCEKGHVNYE